MTESITITTAAPIPESRPWFSTLTANAIIFGSGLLSGILAARLLGAEDRGLLAAVIFWPHFISGLGAMGLNEAIAIRTARSGHSDTLRATVLTISLLLAIPFIIIGVPFLPRLLGEARSGYVFFTQIYFVAFIPLSFVAMNLLAIDQGNFRFNRFNSLRVLQSAIYPLFLIVFWLSDTLSVKTAAIAVLSGTGIAALIIFWVGKAGLLHCPSLREGGDLIKIGIRLHVTNIAMFIAGQVDKVILVLFATDQQIGFYVVAIAAANAVHSLAVSTFINIMLPAAAKFCTHSDFIPEFLVPLRSLIVILFLISLALVFVIPVLLPFIYGADFIHAVPLAQVLAIAFVFVGLKKALIYLLRAWDNNRAGSFGECVTAIFLLSTSYPALRLYGIMGVVMIMLLAHGIGSMTVLFLFARHTGLTLRRLVTLNP
jgi:O-antigen/teichoic acid export membrane protein